MKAATDVRLRLLGGIGLAADPAAAQRISYEKGRALLAYVAIEASRTHARKALAALFWPDLPPGPALANLRQVLLDLRHVLEDIGFPLLVVDRRSVRVAPELAVQVDVIRFLRAAAEDFARAAQDERLLARLAEAAALYRGEFLAGVSLADCPEFEEWLTVQRAVCLRGALALLSALAEAFERRGALASALPFAARFLDLAPWDEEGHRRMMRLLALDGRAAAALAQFEQCQRALHASLGLPTEAQTQALAAQIACGAFPPKPPARGERRRQALPAQTVPAGERRHVSVLYAERLPEQNTVDPEELAAQQAPVLARWRALLLRFGGHLVATPAGGLLAYFGYPVAQETGLRQALQAALALAGDAEDGQVARIGVHAGVVVCGGEPLVPDVIGATTATAIRLRLSVAAGQIATSEEVARLAAGHFDFARVGVQDFAGLHPPVAAYRLLGAKPRAARREAMVDTTPLIGREMELAVILNLWAQVCHGQAQVVQLRGDAGIGKTRLQKAVKDVLAGRCAVREMRCQAEFRQTPFHPVIAELENLFGFKDGDREVEKFTKLLAYLRAIHPQDADAAIPLLAGFLALPLPPPYACDQRPPEAQRKLQRQMLIRLFCNLASRQPVLLLVDDAQWADPSTLDLVSGLVASAPALPVLVILASRGGLTLPWEGTPEVATWQLSGLPDAQISRLIQAVAPDLPASLVNSLVARADGIPLFAEELAKYARRDGDQAIPQSLQDLLAARLDALGEVKATAQLAATLGRAFSHDLLRRVSPLEPQALAKALATMEGAALIEVGAGGNCQFRHALLRDAAYLSQGRARRQQAHLRIAMALTGAGGPSSASHPEQIARHWELGGKPWEAVAHWLAAGDAACRRAANAEALSHYRSGLALLDQSPAASGCEPLEIKLLSGLALAAIAREGYASAEARAANQRAASLCEQNADHRELFRVVWGLWAGASSRAGYRHAEEMARRLMRMASGSGDPVHLAQAHFALGNTLFWQGRFGESRHHLQDAIAAHRKGDRARHLAEFGEDVRLTAAAYLSWVLDMLGAGEEADTVSAESLALAKHGRHPFSQAYALTFAALLQCRRRKPAPAAALAAQTAQLAARHGFDLWRIGAAVAGGWALVQQGRHEHAQGIAQAVAAIEGAMSGVVLVVLGALADAWKLAGDPQASQDTVERALRLGGTLGDHHLDAELLCLKGEALIAQSADNAASAGACFAQALAVARDQQAASLIQRAENALRELAARADASLAPGGGPSCQPAEWRR